MSDGDNGYTKDDIEIAKQLARMNQQLSDHVKREQQRDDDIKELRDCIRGDNGEGLNIQVDRNTQLLKRYQKLIYGIIIAYVAQILWNITGSLF